MKAKRVEVNPYRKKVAAYVGCDWDTLASSVKKEFGVTLKQNGERDKGGVWHISNTKTNANFMLLWASERGECLAHEIFHLTCSILRDVGVRLTDDSEEAYAYLIGWFHENL